MDSQVTREELAEIDRQFREVGTSWNELPATERRRMVATVVSAIAATSPLAVADLAACASLTTVLLGGAQ
jgi:hypothetical protein